MSIEDKQEVAIVKRQLSDMLIDIENGGVNVGRTSLKRHKNDDLLDNNLEDSLRDYKPGSPKAQRRNLSEHKKRKLLNEEDNANNR